MKRTNIQLTFVTATLLFCLSLAGFIPNAQAMLLGTGAQFTARTSDGLVTFDYPTATKASYEANSPFASRGQAELIDQTKITIENNRATSEYKGLLSWVFYKDGEDTIRIETIPNNFTAIVGGQIKGLGLPVFSVEPERFDSQQPIFLMGKDIKLFVQIDEHSSPEEVQFSTNGTVYYHIPTYPFFSYNFDIISKKYQVQGGLLGELELVAPEPILVPLAHGDYLSITDDSLAGAQGGNGLQVTQEKQPMQIIVEYEEQGQTLQTEFPLGASQQVRVYGKQGPIQYTVALSESEGMTLTPLAGNTEGFSKVSLYLSTTGDSASFEFAKDKITRVTLRQSDRGYRYVRTQGLPAGVTQVSKALPKEGSISFEQVDYVQIYPENPLSQHLVGLKATTGTAGLDAEPEPFQAKVAVQTRPETASDREDSGLGLAPAVSGGSCSLSLGLAAAPVQGLGLWLSMGLIWTGRRIILNKKR